MIGDFTCTVERIVPFRPCAQHLSLPDVASHLLFGKGGEAHMTNLQTAHQASGPFEALAFGPDYDHVMSLQAPPEDLYEARLEAGIVVTVPTVPPRVRHDGAQCSPGKRPFDPGDRIALLYRGILPEFTVVAGETYLFGTAVCASGETLRRDQTRLFVSRRRHRC